ncbi:nucleoside diphosphate-linked moiety X motif 19-like [Catharus ustulatus]|uniref:nucleoside diphosphate-linked moiety X motif 19-like n=1 Tax=Catharus ustulatus TaxID=91951 RepID=UPI00140D8F19|nr:nucleoside diphosphate-linked moiety X motif 19-like [Catharus ustulatus]
MNPRLRHWREAATLLLAAGTPGRPPRSPLGPFDYELLLLRRSARSGFMPGAHVFPGGLAEPADFSDSICTHCTPCSVTTVPDKESLSSFPAVPSDPGRCCEWSSPPEAIERFKSQEIWFPPPQFYEFCRLCNFSSLEELQKFSSERALEGCERWMPVMLSAADGLIQLLPGDELYPEDPDYTGEKKMIMSTNKKVEDLMKEAGIFHRIVIKNTNNLAIYVNIQAKYKHINPLMMQSDNSDYNSRL